MDPPQSLQRMKAPRPPNIKLPEEASSSPNARVVKDPAVAPVAPPLEEGREQQQQHDPFLSSALPKRWAEDGMEDHANNDGDDDDDDDQRFSPGLRISGLLVLSIIIMIVVISSFWQVVGAFYTNNQGLSAAVNNGNRMSGAAIRWANLINEVNQRMNLTLTLATANDNRPFQSITSLICEVGSFEVSTLGAVYATASWRDPSTVGCVDQQALSPTAAITAARDSLLLWQSVAKGYVANAATRLNFSAGLVSCDTTCPNVTSKRPLVGTPSMTNRLTWDQDNLIADISRVYPGINFSAPYDVLTAQIAAARELDPTLFNTRVFPYEPLVELVFIQLRQEGVIYFVSLTRAEAFRYIFGFDGQATVAAGVAPEDVAQPFRYSSTAIFVESVNPSSTLFEFRKMVDYVTDRAFWPYRPAVSPNVSAVLSTTVPNGQTPSAWKGDVDYFKDSCIGAMMSSRYSSFNDFAFRVTDSGWKEVQLSLPESGSISPGVVYSIQYNPFTEEVVMCGQVCEIQSDMVVDNGWASVTNKSSGNASFENTAQKCPLNSGQRVFIMSYSSDATNIISVTNTVLNTVGWLAIALVLIWHAIIYAVLAVPIRYLRSRVMATLQERSMKVALARHIITSLTRRVWLGEVKSLSTAVVAVLMKYQENKRYLPDYVKRRQHKEDLNAALEEADRLETYRVATGAFEHRGAPPRDTISVASSGNNVVDAEVGPAVKFAAESLDRGTAVALDPVKHRGAHLHQIASASIVIINLQAVDDAYMTDFARTEPLHLKLVVDLFQIVRRHGGERFGRDTIQSGASWNVFEPDSYHVLHAVQCALDIAEYLRPLRDTGFRVGIAVHTGPVVCGAVGDSYTLSHVVLGTTVSNAAYLADLNRQMSGVSMLVTQPVRQATNIYHEYLAVDAVVSEEDKARGITPNMLFDVRAGRTRSALEDRPSALSAAQSERNAFAEKYNAAFAQFRIHDFAGALTTMNDILRKEESAARGGVVSMSRRMDPIFARLYRLVMYYRRHQELLPKPYSRLIPAWMLYESSADALQPDTLGGSMNPASSSPSDRQAVNGGGLGRPSVVSEIPSSSLPTGSVGGAHFASPLQPIAYGTQFRTQLEEHLEKRGHKRTGSGQSANVPLNRIPTSTTSIQSPSARFPTNQSLEIPPPLSISPAPSDAAFAAEPDSTHTGGGSLSSRGNCHTKVTPSEGARESNSHSHSSTSGTSPAAAAPSAAKLSETVDFASSFKHGTFSNSLMRWGAPRPNNGAVLASLRRSTKAVVAPPPAESASPKPFELITEGELTDDAFQVNPQHQDEFNAGLTDDEDDGEAADNAQVQQHANDVDAHLPDSFTARGKLFRRSNKVIGRTTVGTVFMGMENSTGRMVSVRVLPLPEKSAVEQWELEGDAARFARVRGHPNVVEFHGFAFAGDSLMLALEHVGAGTLESLLKSFQKVPVVTAVNYIRDVLSGVNVLHLEGICHGQLCLENIFVSTTGVCKLTLHDATKWMREMRSTWHEMPYHLAPENAAGSPQFKSDVWAVGIIFLQLITGKAPYKFNGEMSRDMFIFQVGTNRLMPSWEAEELPTYVDEFVKCCLEADPAKRKSAEELLSLPLFFV